MLDNKLNTMRNLFIILLILPLSLFSQTTEKLSEAKSFSLGIVPQYTAINGLRFDLDFRLKNKPNHYIVVAPQLYISTKANWDWDYKTMAGAGLELQHKIFLNDESVKDAIYVAYGPVFNYFSVTDEGLTAKEFIDNGGNYIGLVEQDMTTNIFKFGGNFIIGVKFTIGESLFIDPFVGLGIRFSVDDKTTGLHGYYNEWWGDMGYSGTLLVGGIRIGVYL